MESQHWYTLLGSQRDRQKEDSFGFPEEGTDIKISKELYS